MSISADSVVPPRLVPRTSRVVLYFVAIFALVGGPTVVPWLFILFGPPAFELNRIALTNEWRGGTVRLDGASVRVQDCQTPEAADRAADQIRAGLATKMESRGPGTFRYSLSDGSARGLIVRAETVVVQVEAPDAETVERAVGNLPFLVSNPRSIDRWLDDLFEHHLAGFFVGLGVYLVFVAIFMFKGGAAAAQIRPTAGAVTLPIEAMRQRLLGVNDLDVPVRLRETRRGKLVAEWRLADARWVGLLEAGGLSIAHWVKFELDGERHVARAIDFSRSVRWRGGVAGIGLSFTFFRGIVFREFDSAAEYGLVYRDGWRVDAAYRYRYDLAELKQPLVAAIVDGGWTYRPVAFFLPLLG
jgi:hypothetical protein